MIPIIEILSKLLRYIQKHYYVLDGIRAFIAGDSIQMISEDMSMITNETTLHEANTVSQHHVGRVYRDKTSYDQIRSNFLKQSAKYLRDSFSETSRAGSVLDKPL